MVDIPIKKGDFHCYVSLPEGKHLSALGTVLSAKQLSSCDVFWRLWWMLKFSPQGVEQGCDLQMNSWRTKTSS